MVRALRVPPILEELVEAGLLRVTLSLLARRSICGGTDRRSFGIERRLGALLVDQQANAFADGEACNCQRVLANDQTGRLAVSVDDLDHVVEDRAEPPAASIPLLLHVLLGDECAFDALPTDFEQHCRTLVVRSDRVGVLSLGLVFTPVG